MRTVRGNGAMPPGDVFCRVAWPHTLNTPQEPGGRYEALGLGPGDSCRRCKEEDRMRKRRNRRKRRRRWTSDVFGWLEVFGAARRKGWKRRISVTFARLTVFGAALILSIA